MSYEFSDNDAKVVKNVSNRITVHTSLMGLAGIVGIIYVAISSGFGELDFQIVALQSLLEVIIAIILFRVPGYFRRVADTQGKDIEELTTGLSVLGKGFRFIWIAVLISLLLDIVLIASGGN